MGSFLLRLSMAVSVLLVIEKLHVIRLFLSFCATPPYKGFAGSILTSHKQYDLALLPFHRKNREEQIVEEQGNNYADNPYERDVDSLIRTVPLHSRSHSDPKTPRPVSSSCQTGPYVLPFTDQRRRPLCWGQGRLIGNSPSRSHRFPLVVRRFHGAWFLPHNRLR